MIKVKELIKKLNSNNIDEQSINVKKEIALITNKIQPFIFIDTPICGEKVYDNDIDPNYIEASPFDVFSIEVLNNDIGYKYTQEDEGELDLLIQCIIVNDTDPNNRIMYGCIVDKYNNNGYLVRCSQKVAPITFRGLNLIVNEFISFMNSKNSLTSVNKCNEKIQYIDRENKVRAYKVKEVVYIKHNQNNNLKKQTGFRWFPSHTWSVRGHWRKINETSLGKNRSGEYCLTGLTWVKDFKKGQGELIEKVRVIK